MKKISFGVFIIIAVLCGQLWALGGITTNSGWVQTDTDIRQVDQAKHVHFGNYSVGIKVQDNIVSSRNEVTVDAQSPVFDYQATVLGTSGLLSYYKMDEAAWAGVAGEVVDAKSAKNGQAVNGATTTAVTYKYGTHGGSFDGVNDYVQLPALGISTASQPYSVEAWIYPTVIAGYQYIATNNPSPLANEYVTFLRIEPDGRILFDVTKSNVGDLLRYSTQILSANTWYHIVGVYDGSQNINGLSIYINGILAGSTTSGTTIPATTTRDSWAISTSVAPFKGYMDEMAIYSSTISAPTIATHYHTGTRSHFHVVNSTGTVVDTYLGGDIYGGVGNVVAFTPSVADGATAVASTENTEHALTTSGAKLKSFKNNGVEKAYIDKDGYSWLPGLKALASYIYIGLTSAYDDLQNRLGINTLAPSSTLQVNGSFATAFTNVSGVTSYSVGEINQTIACHASVGRVTLTMPGAISIPGRKYTIKKTDSTANKCILTFQVGQGLDRTFTSYTGLDVPNESVEIVSTGVTGLRAWIRTSAF